MAIIPLGQNAYNRTYSRDAEVQLVNRFFESNPLQLETGGSLLSRPGTVLENTFGSGVINGNYTLAGIFNGDLFVASGGALFRYNAAKNKTAISGALVGIPRFAGVAGAGYQRLFVTDGATLQYYGGASYQAVLTGTSTPVDDTIVIDGVYYQWSAGAPADGAGTSGSPYHVFVNGTLAAALTNLQKAINATGVAGTDYSTSLVVNPRVASNAISSTTLTARGNVAGPLTPGAAVSVVVNGGSDGFSWSTSSLVAGPDVLYGVTIPSGYLPLTVVVLSSYVLVIMANSQRVYYLLPGTTVFDPLNFFEAESQPDNLVDAIAVGDQVWLLGQSSTEPWYATGDSTALFRPVQGRPFSRGVLQGTAIKLADSVLLVGDDNIVYRITDTHTAISTAGITERVRIANDQAKTAGQ